MATKRKLIVISAPSGSGKSTLIEHLKKEIPKLEFSISATNRPIRNGEVDGREYHFLTDEQIKKSISENKFIEWQEVYEGRYYGTLKSEIDRIAALNKKAIFDIDVLGGLNIKKLYKDEVIAIFIQPPSIFELETRLRNRATDSEQDIKNRLSKAAEEMEHGKNFDVIIVNDCLETAKNELLQTVKRFINR